MSSTAPYYTDQFHDFTPASNSLYVATPKSALDSSFIGRSGNNNNEHDALSESLSRELSAIAAAAAAREDGVESHGLNNGNFNGFHDQAQGRLHQQYDLHLTQQADEGVGTPQDANLKHIDGHLLEAVALFDPEAVSAAIPFNRPLDSIITRKRKHGEDDMGSEIPSAGQGHLMFSTYGPPAKRHHMSNNLGQAAIEDVHYGNSDSISFSLRLRTTTPASNRTITARPQPLPANTIFVPTDPSKPSTARLSNVHASNAIFRTPESNTSKRSPTSKKSTRPAMSKLFASLHLSPEDYLRLQAAAKAYMLDPAHGERMDCVGSRGRGDTDMTKLKLHHSVREFLETRCGDLPGSKDTDGGRVGSEDVGEAEPGDNNRRTNGRVEVTEQDATWNDISIGTRFFGPQSEGTHERNWAWPGDANHIICLLTPLLRRMVTNERQRQYAVESRKSGTMNCSSGSGTNINAAESQKNSTSARPEISGSRSDSSLTTTNANTEEATAPSALARANADTMSIDPPLTEAAESSKKNPPRATPSPVPPATHKSSSSHDNNPHTLRTNIDVGHQVQLLPLPHNPQDLLVHFSIINSIAGPSASSTPSPHNSATATATETISPLHLLAHFNISISACRSFPALNSIIQIALNQLSSSSSSSIKSTSVNKGSARNVEIQVNKIEALALKGLVTVADEKGWAGVVKSVEGTKWMVVGGGLHVVVSGV